MSENIKSSLRVLLSEIIDYAGLFPPAQLSMAAAVQNYADYLRSEYSWMLGRFIVPADMLDEFEERAREYWTRKDAKLWRISILARGNLGDVNQRVEKFNAAYVGQAIIDAVEIRADNPAQIQEAKPHLLPEMPTYFELPLTAILPEQISLLATSKTRAKVRTGGVVPEAFPPIDELIKFLRVCIAANVPFKATAGLHHPFRTTRRLTYEEDSPIGTMHGFINLFLSAALLRINLNNTSVHRLMADGNPDNFVFDDDGASWNNTRVDLQQLKTMRQRNIISFGSCSFVEPIEDLQQLGLL